MSFSLDLATENTTNSQPIPAGTVLRVRMDFQGPSHAGEQVEQSAGPEWGGKLLHSAKKEGISNRTNEAYCIPEKWYLKMKLTITGTADSKNINRVIFTEAVIRGGNDSFTSKAGNDVPPAAVNGQGTLWDMCCALRGVAPKSPEGQALKQNPPILELDGKEFVVVTGKPRDENTVVAMRGFLSVTDKRFAEAMAWGKGTTSFGNAQIASAAAPAPSFGGFGNAQPAQQTPPAGSLGGWG